MLLAARTLAWALLIGGWLGLGALTQAHGPAGWAALAPLAAWLLLLGLAARALAEQALSRRALHIGLLLCALAAASIAATAPSGAATLWLLVPVWAGLLALASRCVRALRQVGAAPPRLAASLGALLALACAGDPFPLAAHPQHVAAALALVALLLLALSHRAPHTGLQGGCRAGLFDCALAWPSAAQWRDTARWPLWAGLLGMLPMMAALPLMSSWCATATGLAPQALAGLHLAAMLLPAWAWRWLPPKAAAPACTALLVGATCATWASPGAVAVLAGMLLQAAAWGVAWGALLRRQTPSHGTTASEAHRPGGGVGASAGLSAATVLALGALLGVAGPAAWQGVSLALAALASAGAAHRAMSRTRTLKNVTQ